MNGMMVLTLLKQPLPCIISYYQGWKNETVILIYFEISNVFLFVKCKLEICLFKSAIWFIKKV